jgi:hypothetical protein
MRSIKLRFVSVAVAAMALLGWAGVAGAGTGTGQTGALLPAAASVHAKPTCTTCWTSDT